MEKSDIEKEFDKIPDEIIYPYGEPFLLSIYNILKNLINFKKDK